MEEIKLDNFTDDQVKGLEFLKRTDPILLLMGSAGVGKTTLVSHYCNSLDSVVVTAPTHKAAQILRTKTHASCSTIHSFLKLTRKIVSGRYEYVYSPYNDFLETDVLVVDEASMIDTKLLSYILDCQKLKKFKIVFVGDSKQLNPVEDENSPVFHQGYPEFELKEIVRHKNDIIDLSRNLDWLFQGRNGNNFEWITDGSLPIDLLIEANGSDKCKFITWTNKTVSNVNNAVRSMIYDDPQQLEVGETILMKENFEDYKNNQEVKIIDLDRTTFFFTGEEVPYPSLEVFMINSNLRVLDNVEQSKHEINLKDLKERALLKLISWKTYYEYLESFGQYQYNHALTVHKSQGSSYDYSLVNVSEIVRNPKTVERDRMLYTAITRARTKNILF